MSLEQFGSHPGLGEHLLHCFFLHVFFGALLFRERERVLVCLPKHWEPRKRNKHKNYRRWKRLLREDYFQQTSTYLGSLLKIDLDLSGAMITQLIPIPSARLGQRWKIFLKGNKLRTTFNSRTSKKNIMLLFSRKRARIFCIQSIWSDQRLTQAAQVIVSRSRTVDLIPMDLKRYWRDAHVFLFETLKPRGDTSPLRDPNGSPYIPLTT